MFNREALEKIVEVHPDSFPSRQLLENFHHFQGLYDCLGGRWVHGWGSYLFDGLTYAYEPRMVRKQEELYRYAMTATHALELGVYVGHSLLIMLIANPKLRVTAVDVDSQYAGPAVEYLNRHFGDRVRFFQGDAVQVMEALELSSFDLLHIDADHYDAAALAQFQQSLRLAKPRAIYVFDDYDAVQGTVELLVQRGLLEVRIIPNCAWRNCVAQLTAAAEMQQIYDEARRHSCCSQERLNFNVEAVRHANLRGVDGDIVEIGVYQGGSMIAMLRADEEKSGRYYFLYDTFAGMTAPSEVDCDLNGYHATTLMQHSPDVKCVAGLEDVKKNVLANLGGVRADRLIFVVGDVTKTKVLPRKIAVLRLDTDFYTSTKFELEHFYDLVSPGGIVIVDDYGHWQGCKKAVDEFLERKPELALSQIDYTGVYFQKPGLSIRYVTALFLFGKTYRPLEDYLRSFAKLAESGVALGVYMNPELRFLGEHLQQRFPNVQVLEYVSVDDRFFDAHEKIHLPEKRNAAKDSPEYLMVQLMKLKLLKKAALDPRVEEGALAWVDFGLFHMFRDVQACQERLKGLRLTYTRKILAPGPWLKRNHEDIYTSVLWTYCGSFLLGEKSLFPEAEAQQEAVVQAHLPRLTWEVNYWTQMSCFQWYHADHDDSVLKVPERFLPCPVRAGSA